MLSRLHLSVAFPSDKATLVASLPSSLAPTLFVPPHHWLQGGDEDVFGLEYDLELFNIVAVHDFNMGADEPPPPPPPPHTHKET